MAQQNLPLMSQFITRTIHVKRGTRIFSAGQTLHSLYAVRLGVFKTRMMNEHHREQVTGFYMAGALIGADALASGRHTYDAIALEDGEVCELSYARIDAQTQSSPAFQAYLYRLMAHEINRLHHATLLLRDTAAVQRVVAFLFNLSDEFALRGYSHKSFLLRMTRNEMASYLGLSIETVSRILSRLQSMKLIQMQNRLIELLDIPELKKTMKGDDCQEN